MSVFSDLATGFIHDYLWLGNSLDKPGHCEHYTLDGPTVGFLTTGSTKHSSAITPSINDRTVRICTLSDTHDRHFLFDSLPFCDIMIYSGDIFMEGRRNSSEKSIKKLQNFNDWLGTIPARHIVVVGGNHDKILDKLGVEAVREVLTNATYLCNSSVEVCGIAVWGTPLSHGRSGNSAFQSIEFEAQACDALRQHIEGRERVDILVTHGPCPHLGELAQPRLMHISGHIHAHHGVRLTHRSDRADGTARRQWYRVAAPIMDTKYHPSQLPILIDIPIPITANR